MMERSMGGQNAESRNRAEWSETYKEAENHEDAKKDTSGFQMRYSASEHRTRNQEIERIRSQYAPHEQPVDVKKEEVDELERLRKLDEKAKAPALVVSLSLGVGGTLVLGLGMSMCLAMDFMVLGIIIGVLGMVILSLAFPVHQHLLKVGKEKYGEEIRKLCELLEEER